MTEMEPPTYYANIVTVSVDPDVAYIEIRRFIRTHAEMHRAGKSGAPDAITDETVYAEAPIARFVLTFTAAKALLSQLNEMIPKMEVARRGNQS